MTTPTEPIPSRMSAELLAGGGEMGERMRAFDWSQTPLGPVSSWPQSLTTAVWIMLHSRYPMFVWWGPELINIYNDAYIPVLGARHPRGLGRSAPHLWAEIWDVIGPQTEIVLREGRATWNESVLLVMERHGFSEETYFTYSYSPIPTDTGEVGGVFCACTEDTRRVLGERRLQILRDLGERSLATAKTAGQVCEAAAETLRTNPYDFPFAMIYLLDEKGEEAHLCGSANLEPGSPASPAVIRLGRAGDPWDLGSVVAGSRALTIDDLENRFGQLPAGPWGDDSTRRALVLPLLRTGARELPAGFLIAGISPRLAFDTDYRSFLELTAGQLVTALANARAYEEERERAEALAELDRAKTEFFSNVSHEFRTPLTLMLGPLEDLLKPSAALPAEALDRIEVAYRNSHRLLKLVNTLLDFSRIEAGRIQAVYQSTDLAAFTSELASVFRSALERAGLEFEIDCPPIGEPVYVDREMWEKIVLNLLSNAFKFTHAGKIGVALRMNEQSVELAVSDTGAGIPAAELPHLFERFHRVKSTRARSFEGSGIGLAMVQELVKLHQGEVRVESEVDVGSTFTVTLPRGKAHLPADRIEDSPPPASIRTGARAYLEEALRWLPEDEGTAASETLPPVEQPDPSTAPRPRILLADDNADMRDYVRRLIGQRYEVVAAPDGEEALRLATELPFDLVLSDIMMPKLDGFGLLSALRADDRTKTLPVILLSARAGEESRVEGLDAGADDYLVKPFSARELVARVEAHLKLQRERRAALEALQEAHRRKDEFLALLAHELRNPLAPIRNAAEVLKRSGTENREERWAREVIERQARHLSRLVDDLLDVSRITRGKIELERQAIELSTILERAVETTRPAIDARRHELKLSLPAEPLWIDGDPVRLVQIFGNLLHNAAKYTEEGGHLQVEVSAGPDEATIRVRDDGIGIPPDLLSEVFDLFTQADNTLAHSQGGLGIGLTLVQQLVDLHHGHIEAKSDGVGHGSEFIVRLPLLRPTDEASAKETGDEARDRSSAPLKILVIEDHADSARALQMMLELDGHEARTIGNGPMGLKSALQFRPDVVLCDIGLPGMNGYEVAERLRREPTLEGVTLIALTGYGHREARDRSVEAGFDDHLVKPIEPAALVALLAKVTKRHDRSQSDETG